MSDPLRVLVVDDEQVVLDSVRKHLRREGYGIETVLSAPEALEILGGAGADIVITDLMMPEMDGLELLERMQVLGLDAPAIMITGYATMKSALQALRKGAFDYIAKPFTRAELQGVVARAARQVARGGRAETGAPARDAAGPETHHHLGGHCWVRVEPDGTASIGLEEEFAATVGDLEQIELPNVGDYVEQGSVCLRFFTRDGKTHTLWSALSGSILEVNDRLKTEPALAIGDPWGEGWLLRIEPGNLTEELEGLS